MSNWNILSEENKRKKIAFIFINEIHHLYHFISVAKELSEANDVYILTYRSTNPFLYKVIENYNAKKIIVKELPTYFFRSFTDKLKARKIPRRGFWIKKNKDYILKNFDAVVFTDYYHQYLKKSRRENSPKLLKFPHGMPGRAYSYNKDQLDFDFQLLIGKYQYQQFKKLGLLGEHPVIIGYPKLDCIKHKTPFSYFKNNNKTVLYNPHFDPNYSSWYKFGINILNFFYNQEEYNLIFAPHINLFQGSKNKNIIPQHLYEAENIYIDLGSEAGVDMTYTRSADIYLGDVSSQVFEFILNPRPCVFFNAHNFNYHKNPNFRFWRCGPVISDFDENHFNEVLKKGRQHFKEFKKIQEEINYVNIHTEENSSASERASKAISAYLNKNLEIKNLE